MVRNALTRELVGVISRSDLVKPSLVHEDDEQRRERFLSPLSRARAHFKSIGAPLDGDARDAREDGDESD